MYKRQVSTLVLTMLISSEFGGIVTVILFITSIDFSDVLVLESIAYSWPILRTLVLKSTANPR